MSDTEYPPPWIAVPRLGPDDPTTQGLADAYMSQWIVFWRQLTRAQKDEYLDRWEASPEWRQSIAFRYDVTDEQLAYEAAEFPSVTPSPPPSFIQRMVKFFKSG
ncbi:hypothetical protein AA23498_0669 [Acetobacter nitrogenifigens DSM 23921 = NBRC 105050]|uniref:Uncharacterized protein n=1 Tax=Acetobacter nitrogenifigens DSM 23921 = NBRC 105050 TaxID=1120919 RepID=A0A511X8C3_9PROT|nr:hypothetical protein [Acetobacter nitrogenifigens]GBQ89618.1 hypothetical protein AA23498_0669 [Acetobacter nitrogenifigens DSM 23921 = NBRC 105050]GEN59193.1 hypothetical protein ANI02nite_10770 [Acetobacter nitrogenifigens DSM 23921 = NBRC 105050]